MNEIEKLQEERGKLYGDFFDHCQNVADRLNTRPKTVGFFYIHSKIVRWLNCPTEANRDSAVDCISYIDLVEKHFYSSLSQGELIFLRETKKEFQTILDNL